MSENLFTTAELHKIRSDFPILHEMAHGHPLSYLDNAATSQKPRQTIDAINNYYKTSNANVHRGVHYLSERATRLYEDAREIIRNHINAASTDEVIFVRGTTEAINLVAQSYGRSHLKSGDEVIISALEHHSNIVPWHLLAEQIGISLKVIPINDHCELDFDAFKALFNSNTKLVAMTHISNAVGTINPIKDYIDFSHQQNVPVLIDGAQGAPHMQLDMQALDCDFYAFSGHKAFGPTGIGVLYGKKALLNNMPPYQGGGEMINIVSYEKSSYRNTPMRFEAGTPNISGAIGLASSLNYIDQLGLDRIAAWEHHLLAYAAEKMHVLEHTNVIGTATNKASVISFTHDKAHPHDIGTILDQEGVAVRAGHHCAMPLMERLGLPATVRASFAFYNTEEDIDRLLQGLKTVEKLFA